MVKQCAFVSAPVFLWVRFNRQDLTGKQKEITLACVLDNFKNAVFFFCVPETRFLFDGWRSDSIEVSSRSLETRAGGVGGSTKD